MSEWVDDEYCLHVNSREASDLWAILADWTDSEDEGEWEKHIPRFARLISCWQPLGFIKVFESDEWGAQATGREVTGEALSALLADPRSWEHAEEPTRWICVASGDRPVSELEPGMCGEVDQGMPHNYGRARDDSYGTPLHCRSVPVPPVLRPVEEFGCGGSDTCGVLRHE